MDGLVVDHLVVTARRGGVTTRLVDDVSFRLRRGETLGLVGESGSGKTMTALAIERLLPSQVRIASGAVSVDGVDITALSPRRMDAVRGRLVSMIMQDPLTSLDPVFANGRQIAERAVLQPDAGGRSAIKEYVRGLLRAVQLPAADVVANQYPFQVSGGMRQRVAAAAAFAPDPGYLIADEPTTALDVTVQAQFLATLRDVQRQRNLGVLMITHDLGIVAHNCDRVVVLYAGRVMEQGSTREIFRDPKHPYTQALLHSVPRLGSGRGRGYAIPGQPPDPFHRPEGCPFADRCGVVFDKCQTAPPLMQFGQDREAACWRVDGMAPP